MNTQNRKLQKIDEQIINAREKLVLDHFHDEVDHLWDEVLATFPHPHYEIIPTLTIHDGDADVRKYYTDTRIAFPDQDHEIISLRHSHDAVITEFWLMGTHLGPLGGMPATGGRFRVRITAFFIFDQEENLVCERIYFDSLTMFKQLVGSLNMRNPKNWWLLIKALRGFKQMSSEPAPELLATRPPSFTNAS
jgi:steroid delta-isomerase-like uncharacterized protein